MLTDLSLSDAIWWIDAAGAGLVVIGVLGLLAVRLYIKALVENSTVEPVPSEPEGREP